MKNNYWAVGTVLFLLALSGCDNDNLENTNLMLTEKALMTMQTVGPQTRADYTDTGTSMTFSWRNGDATSVVVNGVSGNENCELITSTDGKNVPFSGTVNTWTGTKNIYAFYPYSATAYTVIGGDNSSTATASLTLPNPQTYTVGGAISNSFMVGAGTATASASTIDASASLKQVMSIIKINISNAPAKVINVNLKCSESVFPTTATVKLSDGTISNPSTLVNELSMTVSDGTSGTDKSISFAMFPADLTSKSIRVDVLFEGGLIKSINKSGRVFERNIHYVIAFDATGTSSLYIEAGGLKWATGNLVADGANDAKIGAPTDGGLYFQYGSLIGWSGGTNGDGIGRSGSFLEPSLSQWVTPSSYNSGTTWDYYWTGNPNTENAINGTGDPCKYYLGGTWRLPTKTEYDALFLNSGYPNGPWSIEGSMINGSTDSYAIHTSGLKFPASGHRDANNGSFALVGSTGNGWSSSYIDAASAYTLAFSSFLMYSSFNYYRSDGFPVRCVSN